MAALIADDSMSAPQNSMVSPVIEPHPLKKCVVRNVLNSPTKSTCPCAPRHLGSSTAESKNPAISSPDWMALFNSGPVICSIPGRAEHDSPPRQPAVLPHGCMKVASAPPSVTERNILWSLPGHESAAMCREESVTPDKSSCKRQPLPSASVCGEQLAGKSISTLIEFGLSMGSKAWAQSVSQGRAVLEPHNRFNSICSDGMRLAWKSAFDAVGHRACARCKTALNQKCWNSDEPSSNETAKGVLARMWVCPAQSMVNSSDHIPASVSRVPCATVASSKAPNTSTTALRGVCIVWSNSCQH
mmetsp:Transcript_40632/g.95486  ORF Transcript_40632/g.95486 Transcript_40632/m.95486 type:complete len:301 (-) Transcript_40632:96-998(-)